MSWPCDVGLVRLARQRRLFGRRNLSARMRSEFRICPSHQRRMAFDLLRASRDPELRAWREWSAQSSRSYNRPKRGGQHETGPDVGVHGSAPLGHYAPKNAAWPCARLRTGAAPRGNGFRGAFPRELVEWLNRMINSREQA